MFGSADVVNVLIAAGANVNAADSQGIKVLDKAKKLGRDSLVKLLEAAGAKATETQSAEDTEKPAETPPEDSKK